MTYTTFIQRLAQWLVIALFLNAGWAMAQAEPTMTEVYATAKAGKLDQAQVMIQQVLISHPKSAKAHFVQSELYARQGNLVRAREALASADKLAPGLPFAKAETVAALRSQLAAKSSAAVTQNAAPSHFATPVAPPAPASSFSWGLPLLLLGGVLVAGYFIFRKRTPESFAQAPAPAYANQSGMTGPQSFGMAGGAGPGAVMQPGYGQAPYGQAGYAQPAGSGLGGRIMGGVATGLAVGAGVMAAEAIARNLTGNHNQPTPPADNFNNNNYQPLASNTDLGGQDFGINDASSWDDSSSGGDAGGGGDWDN